MTSSPWTSPLVARGAEPGRLDERAALDASLDYQRETFLMKCGGLTPEQLRRRSVEPSSMSLLGLLRHLAAVERWWFRMNFDGETLDHLFFDETNLEADFDEVDSADAEADFATYAAELDIVRAVVDGRSLDETFVNDKRGSELSLRWVYLHLIEEYSRHNGHADLLRERIDGVTGE
jgi:hypothetical protein